MDTVLNWLQTNAGRIIWLVLVLAVTLAVTRALSSLLRRLLDRSNMPSASIFINIMRVVVWATAAALVLQPVFGINPTTIVTALGVGGVALSLGLKDTIANVVSGFGLMLGKVVQPGDLVNIAGTTGVVKDITWRQTVVLERNGNEMVIPNSQLNTAQLEKLTVSNEACVTVPFVTRADIDAKAVTSAIRDAVVRATAGMTLEGNPPIVRFTGATALGMSGEVLVFAAPGVLPGAIRDRAARALAGAPWLPDIPLAEASAATGHDEEGRGGR